MAELKKVLSFRVILLITINSIMGTGIFFLPAVGAKYAGPASLISWGLLSLISIYTAMCFAELASMFPKSGGIYEYCKQAYGRFPSFLIGWTTLMAANITIAMLIVGAVQYLVPFPATNLKIIISLTFILIFNYMAYKGMKTSATMLVTFAIITLGTLFSLMIPGFFNIHFSNFIPFFVAPFPVIFITIFFIAETFFGWETVTFLAEETENAEKTIPKALVYGTIMIAVVSLLFVFTSLGTINWSIFGRSVAPLSDLARLYFGQRGEYYITLAVYLSIIGSVAGWIVSAPRLVLALAKDSLFPRQFAKIHSKNFTPYKAIAFQTIMSSVLVVMGFGSYRTLLLLLLPFVLIMYSFVLLAVVVLRYKEPFMKRHFKAPFGTAGPIAVVMINMFLIAMWAMTEKVALGLLKLAGSFILLGIPFYLMVEVYYDPKAIRRILDMFAYATFFTEFITLPSSLRREILDYLGNVRGKKILEFGCGVGTLTVRLAKAVGKKGRVYATDISIKELEITKKRLKWNKLENVWVIHDEKHSFRVFPHIKKFDDVISVGMLGYIQNLYAILKDINKKLPDGGKICFVDYNKFFFGLIPGVEWLSDETAIKKLFNKCGFTINIVRKKGLLWQYVYIFGIKGKAKVYI